VSFKPYPKYKDSGVEWLGRVPEHWEVKPLKYIARFTSGGTPSKTNDAYWDGDVPWASSKDLKSETLEDTADHITQLALDEGAACLIPAGTVLVVVRGMILLHTFPVTQTLVPMAINQDLKALEPTPDVHSAYLPWLLRGSTTETFGRIDEAAHGTKVLRMESWTSIKLPIPPVAEQHTLSAFLRQETAKIDALIAAFVGQDAIRTNPLTAGDRGLIALLQERRSALISAAVTGQIDVRGFPSGGSEAA
jgi:type I restriction enzyme S subunit